MILIILVLNCIILNSSGQYYEGDYCMTSEFQGECRLLENCPKVYAEMLSGYSPEMVCGFIGYEALFCCPPDSYVSNERLDTTTLTLRTTTTESSRIKNKKPSEELTKQKCSEYAKSVYETVNPPTLNINKQIKNVTNCNAMAGVLYIAGGTKSLPRRHQHMAAIGYDTDEGIKWLCGGTLISNQYVLTAAHCLFSTSWGRATWVRLGDLNLISENDDANPQDFRISERIKHPDYKSPIVYHDIALLKLENTVQFNVWIKPACLPSKETKEYDYGIATGWGKVDWIDEEGSNDLLEVVLKMVPNEDCNEFYINDTYKLNHGVVSNWQICAGQRGKDTCQGDSGGPLVIVNDRHNCIYDVIGVTSIGRLCGSSVPGIYTRVSHYVPWIQKIVWPEAENT